MVKVLPFKLFGPVHEVVDAPEEPKHIRSVSSHHFMVISTNGVVRVYRFANTQQNVEEAKNPNSAANNPIITVTTSSRAKNMQLVSQFSTKSPNVHDAHILQFSLSSSTQPEKFTTIEESTIAQRLAEDFEKEKDDQTAQDNKNVISDSFLQNLVLVTLEDEDKESEIRVVRLYAHFYNPTASSLAPSNVTCVTLPAPRTIRCVTVVRGDKGNERRLVLATDTTVTVYSVTLEHKDHSDGNNDGVNINWLLDINVHNIHHLAAHGDYLAFSSESEIFVLYYKLSQNDKSHISFETLDVSEVCTRALSSTSESDRTTVNNDALFSTNYSGFNDPQSIATKLITTSRFAIPPMPKENGSSQFPKSPYPIEDKHCIDFEFGGADLRTPLHDIPAFYLPVRALVPQNVADEMLGPTRVCHALSVNSSLGYSVQDVRLLLYRRLEQVAQLGAINTLTFCPDMDTDANYPIDSALEESVEDEPLYDPLARRLVISTTRKGFLYEVTAHGVQALATYSYMGNTRRAFASTAFLYTLTDQGLECFVLRPARSKHSPSVDTYDEDPGGPCLLAVQQIFGLSDIAVGNSYILFLTKITDEVFHSKNKQVGSRPLISDVEESGMVGWNIYKLTTKKFSELYREMLTLADSYRQTNNHFYHQILLESHYLLMGHALYDTYAPNSENSTAEGRAEMRQLLAMSYKLLADFYFMDRSYERSAILFSYSGERINAVLNKFVKSPERPPNPQSVLASYICRVVFDVQNEAQWERDAENANRIFHIIHKSAPHLLGRLVLRSVVSGYTNDNALPLLENVQMALRSKIADSREWAFVDACNSPASSRRKSTDTKLNPLFDYDEDFFTSPQNAVAQDEFCLWEVTLALAFLNAQNYNAKALENLQRLPESFISSYLSIHIELLFAAWATKASVSRAFRISSRSGAHPSTAPSSSLPMITNTPLSPLLMAFSPPATAPSQSLPVPFRLPQSGAESVSAYGEGEFNPQVELSDFGRLLVRWAPWAVVEALVRFYRSSPSVESSQLALHVLRHTPTPRLHTLVYLEAITLFHIALYRAHPPDHAYHNEIATELLFRHAQMLSTLYLETAMSDARELKVHYTNLRAFDDLPPLPARRVSRSFKPSETSPSHSPSSNSTWWPTGPPAHPLHAVWKDFHIQAMTENRPRLPRGEDYLDLLPPFSLPTRDALMDLYQQQHERSDQKTIDELVQNVIEDLSADIERHLYVRKIQGIVHKLAELCLQSPTRQLCIAFCESLLGSVRQHFVDFNSLQPSPASLKTSLLLCSLSPILLPMIGREEEGVISLLQICHALQLPDTVIAQFAREYCGNDAKLWQQLLDIVQRAGTLGRSSLITLLGASSQAFAPTDYLAAVGNSTALQDSIPLIEANLSHFEAKRVLVRLQQFCESGTLPE